MSKNNENKLVPKLRFPEFKMDSEWTENELGELCQYWNGASHESGVCDDGNYFLISLNSIDINGNLKDEIKKISYTDNSLKTNDMVMVLSDVAHGNFLGLTDIIPNDKYVLNQRMAGLRIKDLKEVNPQFIRYYINKSQKYFKSKGQGSSQLNLSKSAVTDFPVLKPTKLKEQQKIAACLSSLDEVITAESQKLEVLKDHKKGLLQNLLPQAGETVPKFRFKEFEDSGQWVIKSVENNIDLISGIALKSEELSDDKSGTPILRGINITEGEIRHSVEMDKFYLGAIENIEKYLVKEGDIVIAMDGSKVGKNVAMISSMDAGSILIQRVARIRAINADIKYLYQHFLSNNFRNYVDVVNTSSGIPHISAKQIRDFEIGFPSKIEEQQKIAYLLSSLDDLIIAQNQKLEALQLHKKGLLQGLFPNLNDVTE